MRIPVPLSGALRSTRTDADKQCAVNMYPHSDGGYRQFPGLVEFAEISAPTFNGTQTDEIGSVVTPRNAQWVNSGAKLMIADAGPGSIREYTASTAFDESTLSLTNTFAVTGSDTRDIAWNSDGTRFITCDGASGVLRRHFQGGTAFTTSGATDLAGADLSGTYSAIQSIWVDPDDDTILYGATSSQIFKATFGSSVFSVAATPSSITTSSVTGASGLRLNSSKTLAAVHNTSTCNLYTLTTAGDVSTLVSAGTFLVSGDVSGSILGFSTNDDGTKFYFLSDAGATEDISSYALSNPFAFDTFGALRGSAVMDSIPYAIYGTELVTFSSSGAPTVLGQVAGTGQAILDTDGTQLVITTGVKQYVYTVADGVTDITDADLGDAFSNAYLDSTFYFPVDDQVYASALGDASDIGALDFITAESFTDEVLRNLALNQLHYSFGSETTEIHYTSGQGNTRLSRQAVVERGIIGRYAVASIDNNIYILDAERRPAVFTGLQYSPIYVPGLGREFDSYATVSDCLISSYSFEQQNFIQISFPTADVSWVVHEASGEIVKREDWNGSRSRSAGFLNVYGKTLAFDHTNGKIYEFSGTTYQDDGNALNRELYSEKISSELLGFATRSFSLDMLHLEYDVSGSTTLNVSVSKDDGATFSTPRTLTVTGRGISNLSSFGHASEVIVKITTSSNTRADILGLSCVADPLDD